MTKQETIQIIKKLIISCKNEREFGDIIFKLFNGDNIPLIDETLQYFEETVWDIICETRGIPEMGDDEYEAFQDALCDAVNNKITAEELYDYFNGQHIDEFS